MTKRAVWWAGALVLGAGGCHEDGAMAGAGGEAPIVAEGGAGGAAGDAGAGAGEGGAGGAVPLPVCSRFASEVVSTSYGPGQSFGRAAMPGIALGPPLGGGCCAGSLDVVSLGNGGAIEVGFGLGRIVDGPGADFVVFENPFETAGGVYAELATVSVSSDGETWLSFPCATSEPPYDSCAGHTPVMLYGDDGPFEPAAAGGDAFDLADVGLAEARYVRVVDREDLTGIAGVFDLDAVGIVNLGCR